MIMLCVFFFSHVSLELGEEIKQLINRHGPLLKSRQSTAGVGMSLTRQTSRDPGLTGQVMKYMIELIIVHLSKRWSTS